MQKKPDFESIKHVNVLGHEYWSARDLAAMLGYSASWQNFENVIKEAMIAASEVGLNLDEIFNAVIKKSGERGRPQKDYFLSKRACYLVAQNADPRKPEVAAAMNYFAFAGEDLPRAANIRKLVEAERRKEKRQRIQKPLNEQQTLF